MYRAARPYEEFPGKVADGKVGAEEPTPEDLQVYIAQAESDVTDDSLYSSGDEPLMPARAPSRQTPQKRGGAQGARGGRRGRR
jgi:hypothetical protein